MKVRFIGEGDNQPCTTHGQEFPVGEWVEVTGRAAEKLPGNPMFETKGESASDGKPVRAAKPAKAPEPDPEAEADPTPAEQTV